MADENRYTGTLSEFTTGIADAIRAAEGGTIGAIHPGDFKDKISGLKKLEEWDYSNEIANANEILRGNQAYNQQGKLIKGTMAARGDGTAILTSSNKLINLQEGYYSGGTITANTMPEKTIILPFGDSPSFIASNETIGENNEPAYYLGYEKVTIQYAENSTYEVTEITDSEGADIRGYSRLLVSGISRGSTVFTDFKGEGATLTFKARNSQEPGYFNETQKDAYSNPLTITLKQDEDRPYQVNAVLDNGSPAKAIYQIPTAERAKTIITSVKNVTNNTISITASNDQLTGYVEGSNESDSTTIRISIDENNGATVNATAGQHKISETIPDATYSTALSFDGNGDFYISNDNISISEVSSDESYDFSIDGSLSLYGSGLVTVINQGYLRSDIPFSEDIHTTNVDTKYFTIARGAFGASTIDIDPTTGNITTKTTIKTSGYLSEGDYQQSAGKLTVHSEDSIDPSTTDYTLYADTYLTGDVTFKKCEGNVAISSLGRYDVVGSATAQITPEERNKIIPSNICSGISILGVKGTFTDITNGWAATADKILDGYEAYINGQWIEGSMPNRSGNHSTTLSFGSSFTIEAGYYNQISTITAQAPTGTLPITANNSTGIDVKDYETVTVNVQPKLQSKGTEAVPLTANYQQTRTITPDSNYDGLSSVVIASIASQTGGTATSSDIYKGKTAWVNGVQIPGTMQDRGSLGMTLGAGETVTTYAGYYSGGVIKVQSLADLTPLKYTTDKAITSSSVLSGYAGYINGNYVQGNIQTDSNTYDKTLNAGEKFTIDTKYYSNGGTIAGWEPAHTISEQKTYSPKNTGQTIEAGTYFGQKAIIAACSGTVYINNITEQVANAVGYAFADISLEEKNKIIPNNIRKGITILGVTGNYTATATHTVTIRNTRSDAITVYSVNDPENQRTLWANDSASFSIDSDTTLIIY